MHDDLYSRRTLRDYDRRDEKDGRANREVKTRFVETVMEMLPLMVWKDSELKQTIVVRIPVIIKINTLFSDQASCSLPPQRLGDHASSRMEQIQHILKHGSAVEVCHCWCDFGVSLFLYYLIDRRC